MSQHIKGLTLIEVLIALGIVGIAMTAVIKATAENIRATSHLQNKTIATWVGQKILNEVRVGILRLPDPPDALKAKENMLGQAWYYKTALTHTPNKQIKKISIDVFMQPLEEEATPLMSLETYVYKVSDEN